MIGEARAQGAKGSKVEVKRTVCTHCSVGCAIDAVVENGVWVRQEPVFDSPINLGAHCAKGAALREHGHGEYRLRTPMKLVNGKYEKITWDQALNEISAKMLDLKKQSGVDSVFVVGSSKHSNEQAYLLRKWMSLWGSNNCDHQARICHSTTVAGVANTWGYGAMTNSYNDMVHWSTAITFTILAVSGAVMSFGKFLLLPIIGGSLFGWLTYALKTLHNVVGPLFAISAVIMSVHIDPRGAGTQNPPR